MLCKERAMLAGMAMLGVQVQAQALLFKEREMGQGQGMPQTRKEQQRKEKGERFLPAVIMAGQKGRAG
jgi:hypothetical protein